MDAAAMFDALVDDTRPPVKSFRRALDDV